MKQLLKYLNTNYLFCRLVNKDGKPLDTEITEELKAIRKLLEDIKNKLN